MLLQLIELKNRVSGPIFNSQRRKRMSLLVSLRDYALSLPLPVERPAPPTSVPSPTRVSPRQQRGTGTASTGIIGVGRKKSDADLRGE